MFRKSRKQLTIRFLHRTTLFLSSLSLGLALFFGFGNAQHFLDSTQVLILSILSFTSLALVLVSSFLFIPAVILFFKTRRRFAVLALIALFSGAIGLILAVLSQLVILLSRGV